MWVLLFPYAGQWPVAAVDGLVVLICGASAVYHCLLCDNLTGCGRRLALVLASVLILWASFGVYISAIQLLFIIKH